MKICINICPWNSNLLLQIAKKIDPNSTVLKISNHILLDESNVQNEYYQKIFNARYSKSPNSEDREIINRCRLLRSLKFETALKHVHILKDSIGFFLDKNNFDIIITEVPDQFFHDILCREGRKRSIVVISLVQSFVIGRSRLTTYGEYVKTKNSSDMEIREFLAKIMDDSYRPSYLSKPNNKTILVQFKRIGLNLCRKLYFTFKRIPSRYKYYYHFWVNSSSPINLLPSLWRIDANWRKELQKQEKIKIFIPLQFFPEATIDYWVKDPELIQYKNILCKFLKKYDKEFIFALKEHPDALGTREYGFYNDLKNANSNLIIIPPNESVQSCFNVVDAILVFTGTAGFEASIRGIPVLTIGNPYYAYGRFFRQIDLGTTANEIKNFILDCMAHAISDKERFDLCQRLLDGTFDAPFLNNWVYTKDYENSKKLTDKLGTEICMYLASINKESNQ